MAVAPLDLESVVAYEFQLGRGDIEWDARRVQGADPTDLIDAPGTGTKTAHVVE
jgi:hypothetical protein